MQHQLVVKRLGRQDYEPVWKAMHEFTDQRTEETPDEVWLVEHNPVFTQGQAGKAEHLINTGDIPVVQSDRGGQVTYHGPGQRIGYVMLNLAARGRDVRRFVHSLEGWVIAALAGFGVESWRAPGRVGIWTLDARGDEAKIGAIGVRVRRWVTMHGFSVNISPDLAHFSGIVPCGIAEYGVTSLADIGVEIDAEEWDRALWLLLPAFLESISGDFGDEA